MKVTPLEIRQQQFPLRFRGLDPAEVDKFLELVASDMEDLIRDNARLREALAKKDQELQRLQQGEDELKKALTTIQQIREEWIGRAEKQAEQVMIESEIKAKQLQSEAEHRLAALRHDLQELTSQKQQLISEMRHIIEAHLKILEGIGERNDGAEELPRPLPEAPETPGDMHGTHGGIPPRRGI